jgi:hypothetical protein
MCHHARLRILSIPDGTGFPGPARVESKSECKTAKTEACQLSACLRFQGHALETGTGLTLDDAAELDLLPTQGRHLGGI